MTNPSAGELVELNAEGSVAGMWLELRVYGSIMEKELASDRSSDYCLFVTKTETCALFIEPECKKNTVPTDVDPVGEPALQS